MNKEVLLIFTSVVSFCLHIQFYSLSLSLSLSLSIYFLSCPILPLVFCPSGNDLYSATSINFLGSEPVVLRSSQTTLRTEFKSSWLNGMPLSISHLFHCPWIHNMKAYPFFKFRTLAYSILSIHLITLSCMSRYLQNYIAWTMSHWLHFFGSL